MNSNFTSDTESTKYLSSSVKRAKRALDCSPFSLNLFIAMRSRSVPLPTIAEREGVTNGYTIRPLSELNAENYLMWLIQVGILRREVDGQGITDSFRLTPLGRELVKQREIEGEKLANPSFGDRLRNFAARWLRI